MKEIWVTLKVQEKCWTPYHYETVGIREQNHWVLIEYLSPFTEMKNKKMDSLTSIAHNTTPHIDVNYTPFKLIFGKLPYMSYAEIRASKTQSTN